MIFMITILNIREAKQEQYDDVWAIVRYYRGRSDWIRQVIELAPSQELWAKYQKLKVTGNWNDKTFKQIYVPRFLKEMQCQTARAKLNELFSKDREGKNIALVCFCADELLCHRSIIAGLLQGTGCHVKTSKGNDYSDYYKQYKIIEGIC